MTATLLSAVVMRWPLAGVLMVTTGGPVAKTATSVPPTVPLTKSAQTPWDTSFLMIPTLGASTAVIALAVTVPCPGTVAVSVTVILRQLAKVPAGTTTVPAWLIEILYVAG